MHCKKMGGDILYLEKTMYKNNSCNIVKEGRWTS